MTIPVQISNLIKSAPVALAPIEDVSVLRSPKKRQQVTISACKVLQLYKDSIDHDLSSSDRLKLNKRLRLAGYAASMVIEAGDTYVSNGKSGYDKCQAVVTEIAAILSISPQQLQVAAL